jgi:hypothetical protein
MFFSWTACSPALQSHIATDIKSQLGVSCREPATLTQCSEVTHQYIAWPDHGLKACTASRIVVRTTLHIIWKQSHESKREVADSASLEGLLAYLRTHCVIGGTHAWKSAFP